MTEAQQIIESVRNNSPSAVELARVVSLAVRVEPALLRRARLDLLSPDVDAGAEAELWFSPLVESQSLHGLVLVQEVAEHLREDLFKNDRRLFDRAWELLEDFHRTAHPTIRLEENLIRLSLIHAEERPEQKASPEIEGLLLEVLAAMATNNDPEGIARWALRALPQLPERARSAPATTMLAIGAGARLDGRQILEGELPPDAFEKYLPWLLPENIPRVSIGVRRTQNGIEFGSTSLENAHEIQLPKTNPLVVELAWGSGSHRQTRHVTIMPDARQPITLTADQIELRTALGESYLLSLEAGEGEFRQTREIPDFSALRERHRPFFGRERLMERLDQLVWGEGVERSGWIVLSGSPGMGKTAILSQFLDLQERNKSRIIPHLFNLRDFTPETAVRALMAQIERLYQVYSGLRPHVPDSDQKTRFKVMIEEVAKGVTTIDEKLVLLLDGLDEMEEFEALLAYFPTPMPNGVVAVCSTRVTERYRKWAEGQSSRNRLFVEIELNSQEWLASNEEACRAFWNHSASHFDPPLESDLVEFLIRRAEGSMLYTRIAHEWLSSQPTESRRMESLPQHLLSTQSERQEYRYIVWLQGALNQAMRTNLPLDGRLGPQTRDALIRFQMQWGLAADGIFDVATEAALIRLGILPIRKSYEELFETDIFISYAHTDNETIDSDRGWIDLFEERLRQRLHQLRGEDVKIWRDSTLQTPDDFDKVTFDKLSRSALFISVVSPRYIRSEWCMRELSEFARQSARTGGLVIDGRSRIFKVVKTPIERADQPPELQNLLGYEFYETDPATNRHREFDLKSDPRRYLEKLDDLASDLVDMLTRLKSPVAPPSEVSEPKRAPVYLAETVFDLKRFRDRIKQELQSRGRKVLPESDLPLEGDAFRNSASNALRESDFSIHIVGSQYGIVPEGEDKSVVELQYEMARERAKEPDFTQLVWAPPELRITDPRQKQFIDRLESESDFAQSADFVRSEFEEFLTIIQDKLAPVPNIRQENFPAA